MNSEMVKWNGNISVHATIGGSHLVAITGVAVTGLCLIVFGAMKNGYGVKAGNLLLAPTDALQCVSV